MYFIYVCISVHMHMYICAHMYIYIHIYIYTCTYVHTYVCAYNIYIYIELLFTKIELEYCNSKCPHKKVPALNQVRCAAREKTTFHQRMFLHIF